ncbi:MAG: HD domain-containing protein [Acidimicrobiia bacterium]|nr:HD domain-containing protein [Acidimicrobiia bacterium]
MTDGFTVNWTQMSEGTREDYVRLDRLYRDHAAGELVGNLLATFRLLEGPTLGYRIDRARHSRQSATRALRNGEPGEFVVAALFHDIGDVLAPENHSAVAADVLEPYVSEETAWVIRHHGLFQGYYYFHHLGEDRDARERYAGSLYYDRCVDFCASYDQNCFDPHHDDLLLEDFVPLVEEILSRPVRQYRA